MSIKKHRINSKNNFIEGYYNDNYELCDKLINYFKNSKEQSPGFFGDNKLDRSIKASTDVSVTDVELVNEYLMLILAPALEKYKEKYKFCTENCESWGISEYIKIQHYHPGEGFFSWHAERSGPQLPGSNRHLVFMTYLNDVSDGGETEFYYQKIKVKPEKGLTLLWGSDWTFTHRGITSPTEEKYIITGWFNFLT